MTEDYPLENGMRIIQETVPGRQVTLAHIIASPDPILYQKLGLDPSLDYDKAAIGISTVTPLGDGSYHGGYRHEVQRSPDRICGPVQRHPDFYRNRQRGGDSHGRHADLCVRKTQPYGL